MASINLQNQCKTPGLLKCYVARPGHKLLYSDINSLEPHIMTYYSRDPKLLSIYGPGAGPNCIYLWFGSSTKTFRSKIAASTYDQESPTKEGIAQAKIDLAELRDVLKSTYLGCLYGLGPKNLKKKLNLEGFPVTKAETYDLHSTFWRFFGGVKRFETALMKQYYANNGYIINGRGRPLTIDSDFTKDIVNRFVQSTGHDCLLRILVHINRARRDQGINIFPYLPDEHDACIFEVPDDQVEAGKAIYMDAYKQLNEELKWDVKIKGVVKVGVNLAVKL